jgi:hypothetical protein
MLGSIPRQSKRRRKGEGKSRPALPPTRARIAIKGHLTWATIGLQKDDHRFYCCLLVEVLSGLCKQRDRGASIHKIAHLDHPAFACSGGFVEADTLLTSLKSI